MNDEIATTLIRSFFHFMEIFCSCGAVTECIKLIVALIKYAIDCGNIEEGEQ